MSNAVHDCSSSPPCGINLTPKCLVREPYRGLYEHGSLITHLPHDVERIHGLIGLDQAHGRLHGDEHARATDAGTAVHDGRLGHAAASMSDPLHEVEEVAGVVRHSVVGPRNVLHLRDVSLLARALKQDGNAFQKKDNQN